MRRLRVEAQNGSYDVVVGRGAWRALRPLARAGYSSIFVLTERRLWRRWGTRFIGESGLAKAKLLFVPPGEASKSLKRVEEVAAELLERGADRRSLVIAFGGGVVGDLGGFVASTYMRGIDFVQAPTTVVGQVDSAVGGKTGVNLGAMKNLVGTFAPPRLVVADPVVLGSMRARAFRSGLYEVVKHAILVGDPFFSELERKLDALRADDVKTLAAVLERAVAVKVDVVSRDEREVDLRQVLNLGHTFGHALEEATRYRRFMHGEAVGWGLIAATHLARRAGVLARGGDEARIIELVRRVGPLPSVSDLAPKAILKLLPRDKKAVGGRVRWVLPERVGKVRVVEDVPPQLVASAWRDVQTT